MKNILLIQVLIFPLIILNWLILRKFVSVVLWQGFLLNIQKIIRLWRLLILRIWTGLLKLLCFLIRMPCIRNNYLRIMLFWSPEKRVFLMTSRQRLFVRVLCRIMTLFIKIRLCGLESQRVQILRQKMCFLFCESIKEKPLLFYMMREKDRNLCLQVMIMFLLIQMF